MTTIAIRGGSVFVDALRVDSDVVVDGPTIAALTPRGAERHAQVIDAAGCSVLPGFVDLQVNGAVGVDLTTQPERIGEVAEFVVQCGVTSFMPTVISSSAADTTSAVAAVHEWSQTLHNGARSLGVHLEGPFLNPARAGAHPVHHLRHPSLAEASPWSAACGVSMVTISPELPLATGVIAQLVANGVVVCAGHTDADGTVMSDAIDAGIGGVTHLFNAMGTMSARQPGAAGATLADSSLIVGLIVDGLHVDPVMVRLAWKLLGPTRLALVSDAMSALGLDHGRYTIGETPVVVDAGGARTDDGTLAGSVLRFDQAVRNLMAFTGCDLGEASTSASVTPAQLARRYDIGRLAPGYAADIVLLDAQQRVAVTIVQGRVAFDPQHRCEKS